MNEQELCQKRLLDISRQADQKGIVLFSDFLNLNEQNIFHASAKEMYTTTQLFGGYEGAERQMVAFIPDALCYEWDYPIFCLKLTPQYPKYAERLTHRDILGSIMSLGVERNRFGDIVCQEQKYYIFCEEKITDFIMNNLSQVRHTAIKMERFDNVNELHVVPDFEDVNEIIASNRIDCIIAKAYHLSRSEAAAYLVEEKVFINGKNITNCNQTCENGAIISVRGKGRFIFKTDYSISKKGKLRVCFEVYK